MGRIPEANKLIGPHMKENNIIFREVQQFRQTWLWSLIIIITAFTWYIFISQAILGIPAKNHATGSISAIFWLVSGIILPIFFYSLKLTTEVRTDGLYIRFSPLHRKYKKIPVKKDTKYYERTYSPITEYGGWGIRLGLFGKGRAYNVSGNRGLQLEFNNKKRLLIGSQKPGQLKSAIDTHLKAANKRGNHETQKH